MGNEDRKKTKDELRVELALQNKPSLRRIFTLQDMEVRLGNCDWYTTA